MKTVDFQDIKVRIDRPKGFVQKGKDSEGKEWERTYKLDYGFIPKTDGGDGEGVDVFLGPDKEAHEAYWAVQVDSDGKFDEYKVLLGFPNKAAAKKAYIDHIPEKHLSSIVAMRIEMMKALLGKAPLEKLAYHLAFLDELNKYNETIQ